MNSDAGFDNHKRLVAQGYDQVAHEYACLEAEGDWPRMRWLRKLLRCLETGAAVLDLRCRSGDPADVEIARAHQLIGVDISQTQIRLALRNAPAGRFIQGDAGSVGFAAHSFDAVVSFYALEHMPREEHGPLLRRIHRWLRPEGWLLLGTEAGAVEGVISEWLGVPMYFSSFEPEVVKGMVNAAGFEIVESAIESQVEQGQEIPYLWLLARKEAIDKIAQNMTPQD